MAMATSRPPSLRTAQVLGGCSSAISSVEGIVRRPTRRTTVVFDPTVSGASPSRRTATALSCHSGNKSGLVAYEKTSSGRREISMLSTISAIWPPLSSSVGGIRARASLGSPRSELFDGLDFEVDVDLLAHNGSAALEGGVPGDPEVIAMDHGRG